MKRWRKQDRGKPREEAKGRGIEGQNVEALEELRASRRKRDIEFQKYLQRDCRRKIRETQLEERRRKERKLAQGREMKEQKEEENER